MRVSGVSLYTLWVTGACGFAPVNDGGGLNTDAGRQQGIDAGITSKLDAGSAVDAGERPPVASPIVPPTTRGPGSTSPIHNAAMVRQLALQ